MSTSNKITKHCRYFWHNICQKIFWFCGILNFFFRRVCSVVCLLVWKETNTIVSCVLYKYVWPSTKLHNKIYHLLIILGTNIFLPFVAIDVEWSTSHLCCMKFACKRATRNELRETRRRKRIRNVFEIHKL